MHWSPQRLLWEIKPTSYLLIIVTHDGEIYVYLNPLRCIES